MSRPGLATLVRLLVGLLLVLVALPAATAQTSPTPPQVSGYLDDPGHPLQPGSNESIVLHVLYTPGQSTFPFVSQDPNDPTNATTSSVRITFSAKEAPTWVDNVTFSPPELLISYAPSSQGIPGPPVDVILHINRNAPADNHQNLSIAIHADANGPGTPPADGQSTELRLRPGVVPKIKVDRQTPGQLIVKGGRWQPITFLVTNTGNGEVSARLNVTSRPQDSIVDFPPTVTLQPGQTVPVEVLLKLPWTYGESGTLTLEATPMAVDVEGKAAHVDVDIAGQSAVPALEPLVAVALVGALALARRRA
jgi:hypothetical protein